MARKPNRVFFIRRLKHATAPIKEKTQRFYNKVIIVAQTRPLTSFFALLAILLALIILGNILTKPKVPEEQKTKEPKEVETYAIGSAPKITIQAQIEKEGVVQIAAQTPGIVYKINVSDGQTVAKGQNLVSLSSNYQGANQATISRKLATNQLETTKVAYEIQKEIITKQKELAEKNAASSDELRSIADKSLGETRTLISLNESILTTIESNLQDLEEGNVGRINDAVILQTKQLQSQFLGATNQARSALRNTELQADKDKPPTQLSNLQKEIALKQLDLQQKTLTLGLEASSLQLKLAQINESTFFPTTPFKGTVERVHVRVGQQVTPGTPIVTISSQNKSQTAVAYVPQNIAKGVSKLSSSFLHIDGQRYEVTPIYISQEAVQGQLYTIVFPIPEDTEESPTDKGFIDVEVPIGYSFTSSAIPYIPLDAVHQTQDLATVFVVNNEKAEGKTVTLGQVQGNFIEITSGLSQNDVVIINRNIVSQDLVKIKIP